MRGFGILILIVGVVALIAAMNMDVSVLSGLGWVSNVGLIARQQNLTMVAGLAVISGLLMMIFGNRHPGTTAASEPIDAYVRPCPLCAETIKNAAIKCKHCGADVESLGAINRRNPAAVNTKGGWTVRFECAGADEMSAIKQKVSEMPSETLKDDGATVIVGFFQDKEGAKDFRNRFSMKNGIDGDLYFQPVPLLID